MKIDEKKTLKELTKKIERMEFEQRIDGKMRCVRLVMPLVSGAEAMHLTGVEAQKAQLRFILLTAAGVCNHVGKKSLANEIQGVLRLLLTKIDGNQQVNPTKN